MGGGTITLTGDVTGSGSGSIATTLSNTGVVAATYGDATHVGAFTVDAKGRITAASNIAITGLSAALTNAHIFVGSAGNVATDVALSGDATISNAGVLTIANAAISYAKIQNVTDARLLGRSAGSAGAPMEITVGTGLSLAGGALTSSITQYTDEAAQDAVGSALTDTATIDATYNDAGNAMTFDVKANSIDVTLMHATATDVGFGRSSAGAGAGEEFALTAAGRALIDDASAAAQRTTLGLGTIATQNANAVAITGGSITNITDLVVADGGTGVSTLTNHGILLGQGSGALVATAVMTDGQLLVGQSAADPLPKTVSGDMTMAATGAITISNAAVTYAKIQNVAASSLVGNPTGSAAAMSGITLGQGLAFSGTTLASSMTLLASTEFVANGTWTKNANTKLVYVQVIGGGASGGGGAAGTNAANRNGGSGGSAGEVVDGWFLIADAGSPQTITVGAQQTTVGLGVTGTTAANVGTAGNASSFGSILVAQGGFSDITGAAVTPGGITHSSGAGNIQPGAFTFGSTAAVAGWKGGRPSTNGGPGGGATGAAVLTAGTTSAGALGGAAHASGGKGFFQNTTLTKGEGGGTVGPNASATAAIAAADASAPWFGDGGPSGGSSTTTNGGAGADGAIPGGGGGGGGACRNANTSGAGGKGARGAVRVWEFG